MAPTTCRPGIPDPEKVSRTPDRHASARAFRTGLCGTPPHTPASEDPLHLRRGRTHCYTSDLTALHIRAAAAHAARPWRAWKLRRGVPQDQPTPSLVSYAVIHRALPVGWVDPPAAAGCAMGTLGAGSAPPWKRFDSVTTAVTAAVAPGLSPASDAPHPSAGNWAPLCGPGWRGWRGAPPHQYRGRDAETTTTATTAASRRRRPGRERRRRDRPAQQQQRCTRPNSRGRPVRASQATVPAAAPASRTRGSSSDSGPNPHTCPSSSSADNDNTTAAVATMASRVNSTTRVTRCPQLR